MASVLASSVPDEIGGNVKRSFRQLVFDDDGVKYGRFFKEDSGEMNFPGEGEESHLFQWNTRLIDVPEKYTFPGSERVVLHFHNCDPKDAEVTLFLTTGFSGNPLQFEQFIEETIQELHKKGFEKIQIYAPLTMGMGTKTWIQNNENISNVRLDDKQEDHGDITEAIIKTDKPGGEFYFIGHSAGEQIQLGGIEAVLEGEGDVRNQLKGILNINGVKQIPWEWFMSLKTLIRVAPFLPNVLNQTANSSGNLDLTDEEAAKLFFGKGITKEQVQAFMRYSLPDSAAMFGGDFALPWEMDPELEGSILSIPKMIGRTLTERNPKPRKLDKLATRHPDVFGANGSLTRQMRIATNHDQLLGGNLRANANNKLRRDFGMREENIRLVVGVDSWHCLPVNEWSELLKKEIHWSLDKFFQKAAQT